MNDDKLIVAVELMRFKMFLEQLEDLCTLGALHWTTACSLAGNFITEDLDPCTPLDMLIVPWVNQMYERWSK